MSWIEIEIAILDFINNHMHTPWLDEIMIFLTNLGNFAEIWIAIGIILLFFKKQRKVGLLVLISLLFMKLFNEEFLKVVISRDRPFKAFPGVNLLIDEPHSNSFPSGHTASAFAAAFVLIKFYKKYTVLIIGFASLMAFTRLYLYVHYPTDILGGIVSGYLCSFLTLFLYKKYTEYRNKNTLDTKKAA